MGKVAVVYWSGTGNTEAMANAVVEGVKSKGGEVDLIFSDDFGPSQLNDYDAIAFGCPAMGNEVLEESSFEPMFESVEGNLGGKKIAIFGSYEWNDGQWMRDWEERVKGGMGNLVYPALAAYDNPDDDALAKCRELGAALV
ncbi:MAG: flavodoxin [Peptoanaerobacter stomatis]|uniref:flavodoxin n=1 Tax=Peptoanaerobacter stomatis TaxID=796937 RepID=UPI003FA05E8E